MSADDTVWVPVRAAEDVTPALIEAALEVVDGWYDGGNITLDWEDILDRVDGLHLADGRRVDLGSDTGSPAIKALKAAVKKALREGSR